MAYLSETLEGRDYGKNSFYRPAPKKTKGKVVPVPKRSNPYLKPKPGGGTSPTAPSLSQNLPGMLAQAVARKPIVAPVIDVNYESDPTLARIKALGQQQVGDAQTEAAALRKQAIVDTGLADIGSEIGLDASTLQAARENPFSVAQRIQRESQTRGRELDESLNQQNLFYGGERINQLSELARSTADEQNNLVRDLRAALGGIDEGVLEAQRAAALAEQEAMEEAAAVARQAALDQAYNDALAAALNPFGLEDEMAMGGVPTMPMAPALPQILTPEEELLLSLGVSPAGFTNYAI